MRQFLSQQNDQGVPVLDRSNPLCRSLFFAATPRTGLSFIEPVIGKKGAAAGSIAITPGVRGLAYSVVTSASDGIDFAVDSTSLGLPVTLGVVFVPDVVSGTLNLFTQQAATTTPNTNSIGLRIATGVAQAFSANSAGTTRTAAAPGTVVANTLNVVVGVFIGATSRQCWLNGIGGTVNTTSSVPSLRDTLSIGSSKGVSSRQAGQTGGYYLACLWRGALSSAEILAFSQNPWRIFKNYTLADYILGVPSSGVTGTASPNLGDDTSSGTGTTIVTGSGSVTLDAATSSASGSPASVGSAAITLGSDTSASVGTTTIKGTAAATLGGDTSSAQGSTTVKGTATATLGNDTSSASGSVGSAVSGTAAITLSSDISTALGTTTVKGSSAIILGTDSSSAIGTTRILGTAAITLGTDFATAFGTAGGGVTITSPQGLTIRIGLAL